jgi:hypothetical protein
MVVWPGRPWATIGELGSLGALRLWEYARKHGTEVPSRSASSGEGEMEQGTTLPPPSLPRPVSSRTLTRTGVEIFVVFGLCGLG